MHLTLSCSFLTGTATQNVVASPGVRSCPTAVDVAAKKAAVVQSSDDSDDAAEADQDEYVPHWRHRKRARKESLAPVAEALDGCDISSKKGAELLTVFSGVKGGGCVTRSKLRWALETTRDQKIREIGASVEKCDAAFFDGRNDVTRVVTVQGELRQREESSVHNISVNMHPGDIYMGHLACPTKHTGQAVAQHLHDFLTERGYNLDKLMFVGGDGTNANVGHISGTMACLERMLGRPLTRIVCLCHQAELPYRALFRSLDGDTKGPYTWGGPIGRQLSGPVHTLPLVNFGQIPCEDFPTLPAEVQSGLSKDLQLLYQCAKCVVMGDSGSVTHRRHAKLNMARWYTAQSRLLRYYMSEIQPSEALATLARYIACVYVPTVIDIKKHSDIVYAPQHFFQQLKRQRESLNGDTLLTVQRCMSRNAHAAHPENVVLGMLGDEDGRVREEALLLIESALSTSPAPLGVGADPHLPAS